MSESKANLVKRIEILEGMLAERHRAAEELPGLEAELDDARRDRDTAMAMLKDTVGEILEATDNQVTLDGDKVVIADYAKVMRDLREQRDAKHDELCAANDQLDYYKADLDAIRAMVPNVEGVSTQDLVRDHLAKLTKQRDTIKAMAEAWASVVVDESLRDSGNYGDSEDWGIQLAEKHCGETLLKAIAAEQPKPQGEGGAP